MPDYIDITPPLEKLSNFIAGVPAGVKRITWKTLGLYFLGNGSHGLGHYPPNRYVSRQQAGYTTSQAQMRFFFATGILENVGGQVVLNRYERTGYGGESWVMKSNDNSLSLSNDRVGWTYVEGPNQANQPRLVGWRKAIDIVISNMNGAIRSAQQAVNKWLAEQYEKG